MPTTITAYNTFTQNTKARSGQVNTNFSNHRGDLLPINETTATASDNAHDLGSATHQWKDLHIKNLPTVDGSPMGVIPVGAVIMGYESMTAYAYFLCDGSEISRATYSALFGIIGTKFGIGDNSTTFAIPDYRGIFPRGTDKGAGRDPDAATRSTMGSGGAIGDTVGSYQGDSIGSHTHEFPLKRNARDGAAYNVISYGPDAGANDTLTSYSAGGAETRPKNLNTNFYIKY